MDLGLRGRAAVVTGASKGIGFAAARALAAEGCAVTLVARTAVEDAAARLRAEGAEARGVAMDLSLPGSAAALLAATGAPDILVNNAGAIPAGDLDAMDEARWRDSWELKVFGYVNLSRAFLAAMRERGGGVILNVTGLAAERHDWGYVAGTTGNAALNAFTRAVGGVSPDYGVRVLAVQPGLVETERLATLLKSRRRAATGSEEGWREALASQPLGRAATVEEVADVISFLVSPRAGWVSGTVVTVDGGAGSRNGNFGR